ncbi:PREDICTED: DDT domain-containing protein PTM [Nelumbo nucifera]|uniref:DDT domain-containing protein PTM n=2 Tax=Nelumbo nucifera TaxID=4432 RepID=A0A1U8AYN7_NELNU|nr:PREDICTED: DDT domain-containing protein PTM [Nelumbo nucifera]DAD42567.1 TPA_asm: hypothetical protein HUJ06_000797 [Nelumbo nucifera]
MEFVGRTLKKQFRGVQDLAGVVESYDESSGVFKISYEGGGSEEIEFDEVASILEGKGEPGSADLNERESHGRKPKKRRLEEPEQEIRSDSGKSTDCVMTNLCFEKGYEETQVKDGLTDGVYSETLEMECELGRNLRGNASVNRYLRENGCSDGFNLNRNVPVDENLKKNADSDGDLDGNDCVGSAEESPEKRYGVLLNYSIHEEEAGVKKDHSGEDFIESAPFKMHEETQIKEFGSDGDFKITCTVGVAEETQIKDGISNGSLKEDTSVSNTYTQEENSSGFSKGKLGNACIRMVEESQEDERDLCGDLQGNALPEVGRATCIKDGSCGELQLKEVNYEDDFAVKGNGIEMGTPDKDENSCKKRRRLSDNLKSTKEKVLRRSARRTSSQISSLGHTSSTEKSSAADNVSTSPAVNSLSEEKSIGSGCVGFEGQESSPSKLALPPSSKTLDLDGIPIFDLFSVYACLRSFSTLLFLSPFSVEAFVVALKCKSANSLIDFVHFSILRTLKMHLEFFSDEGSQSASACPRTLNWQLLDPITWPVFLVEYLLVRGSGLKSGFDLSQLKLLDGDYYKQSVTVKVEILRCLCDDVIEVEAVRLELNRRMRALDMDIDKIGNLEIYKKKKDPMDDSAGSCLTEEIVDETIDWNSDECCLCKMDGSLICCDGCPAAYHSRCVGISKDLLPEGDWYCPECEIDKNNMQMKSTKSVRGAELLGIDPYGRLYFGSSGYLLVSDSCDSESSYYCYHKDDLNAVLEVLKSSDTVYGQIISTISSYWGISSDSTGAGNLESHAHTVSQDIDLGGQISIVHLSSSMVPLSVMGEAKNEAINEGRPNEGSVISEGLAHQSSKISDSISRLNSATVNQFMEMASPLASSEGSADISQVNAGKQTSQKNGADCSNKLIQSADSEIPVKLQSAIGEDLPNPADLGVKQEEGFIGEQLSKPADLNDKQEKGLAPAVPIHTSPVNNTKRVVPSPMQFESGSYVNCYIFAQTAASVAEELLHKSSERINEDPNSSVDEIVSAQLKVISKKSTKLCWSNIQNLYKDLQKENCGWCFSCKNPTDSGNCLFNMFNKKHPPEGPKSGAVGLHSKKNRKNHLFDVIHHILSIEHRLSGLLSGPWQNPLYSMQWRKSVLKASDIASVKRLLLILESSLRRIALSEEWLKQVDSVFTMGSASHVLTTSVNLPSKHGIGRKRGRFSDADSSFSSNTAGSGIFWWRGGRLSRQVYHWMFLPHTLAYKAGRQAGCIKIPGILYPDGSELAKRSKYIAWRAALEMCISVPQLAFQVRELDSNIRWDDLENNMLLFKMSKELWKLMRPFKKVTIRRKCMEGAQVKYLLDFGKRKTIPDAVLKHGVMLEVSSSERKKYWLDESHVPLNILKAFEEKKLSRTSNKQNSAKLQDAVVTVLKNHSRRIGLSYLMSKGEKSENYQCGHCNKDVLVSEAVDCQHCKGFFHKRHVKKSKGTTFSESIYTCHKCINQDIKHMKGKTRRGKTKSKKSKKASADGQLGRLQSSKEVLTEGRSVRLRANKKISMERRPVQSQTSKKTPMHGRLIQTQVSKEPPMEGRVLRSRFNKKVSTEVQPLRSQNGRKASKNGKLVGALNSKKSSAEGKPKCLTKKVKYLSLQSKQIGRHKKGKKSQTKKRMSNKSKKETCWPKRKRTKIYHTYWLNGLHLSRKANDDRMLPFRERKLILPSKSSSDTLVQPKCCLCFEAGHTPSLAYVGCENCEDWFHADAFGLTAKTIDGLLGFRCHKCRKRNPPNCPHRQNMAIDGVNSGKGCAQDVSDIDILPREEAEKEKASCEEFPGSSFMHEPVLKKQKIDLSPDSKENFTLACMNKSEKGSESVNNEWKGDKIPDSVNGEQKSEVIPDPNETVMLDCETEPEGHATVHSIVDLMHQSCKSEEDVIERQAVPLGCKEMEDGSVETTTSPEAVVSSTLGDSTMLHSITTLSSIELLDTGDNM